MKANNKTVATKLSPTKFLESFPKDLQKEAEILIKLFEKVSKKKCIMWGQIFGFGTYHFKSLKTGREGDYFATGFALRKVAITIYIMCGVEKYGPLLKKLGKFKISGGSCIYVKKLGDIDLKVLEKLIKQGLVDLKKTSKIY